MTVPAHLLLGTLGSGKTTTLLKLLETAPAGERWAVFINEFGNVSLDGALVQGGVRGGPAVFIEERHSGCICCSARGDFKALLPALLRRARPDRLIIEPTGLADPRELVASLRESGTGMGIRLDSVIGHVDCRLFRDPGRMQLPFWQGLLSVSDHLLATKVDRARPELLARFLALDRAGEGPVLHVDRDQLARSAWRNGGGRLPGIRFMGLLDKGVPGFTADPLAGGLTRAAETAVFGGLGTRLDSRVGNVYATGWILSREAVLPDAEVRAWIKSLAASDNPPLRLKGILHTDKGILSVQYVPGDPPEFGNSRYGEDSRLEILFSGKEPDWNSFESLKLHDPVVAPVDDFHQPA